jgi:hypothetical protein
MTHDELLALIYRYSVGRSMLDGMAWDAVHKVVELHKPYDSTIGPACTECSSEEIIPYPCETIQVVEREM